MSIMKQTLELEELSYRENGRNDPRYKTFKKHLMATTYDALRELFTELEQLGIVQRTDYEENLKNGYKDGPSGGSGYINTLDMDDWINSAPVDDSTGNV